MLTRIFTFAVRRGYIKRNLIVDHKVMSPSGDFSQIAIPSIDEVKRLLATLDDKVRGAEPLTSLRRKVMVPLAAFCGLRIGEICALKWENVRFDLGVIQVRHNLNVRDGLKLPKSKAGLRDVPISPMVFDPLLALHEACGAPASGFVMVTRTHRTFDPRTFWEVMWRPLVKRAGLEDDAGRPKYHFHALRHVAVSLMIRDGLTALHVKRFIGHANASTTLDIYGHLFPEDQRIAASVQSVAALFDAMKTRLLPAN